MPISDIRVILIKLEQQIKKQIKEAERFEEKYPSGKLRISSVKGKTRYYHNYIDEKGCKHSTYISAAKDMNLIAELAQSSYNRAFLKTAYEQLAAVQTALKNIDEAALANVYALLHNERKKLINPFVPDQERFIREWKDDSYPPGRFSKDIPEIYTENGERVRSKSEKIIADKYKMLDIPYKYEKPLILLDHSAPITVRPDFTLLNKRTLMQRYHEHLGRLDDPKYIFRNIYKLKLYERNGIFIGEQLFLTLESSKQTLDMKQLELMIKKYLA
ncbi:MAG: hypothetical protein K6G34_04855 [Lachnospiraceae bacterium]|nr:hypothetical protein [Lachnospiraceae bacterium]